MSAIRDYVMAHDLFCHHDHHWSYREFDRERDKFDYASLLSYATADLVTAAGTSDLTDPMQQKERIAELWPMIRATGYGRAVDLTSRTLLGIPYTPEEFPHIDEALQDFVGERPAGEIYHELVHDEAQNLWTIHDGCWSLEGASIFNADAYPDTYRFTFRLDELFAPVDREPIDALAKCADRSVHTLDQLVSVLNECIDRFQATGRLAALKIGMAYLRDLRVGDPTRHEAELAFNRISSRKLDWGAGQQNSGAVNVGEGRPLGDYMFHKLIQRAADGDIPVQIHTGYMAGNWQGLDGTRAALLVPIFDKYREVRFDLFHASWPWTSQLGAIAKNYPNVWPDMCWAWAMNPTETARALSEWLDGIPFNKIFAYGADTDLPWCNVGYSLQAKGGIANVLEGKIAKGFVSEATAREIADRIMLENGKAFYGLG